MKDSPLVTTSTHSSAIATWLAADPEATDELLAGNSVFPTLCCAIMYPWYILARVAAQAKMIEPELAFGIGAFAFSALIVGGVIVESTSPGLAFVGALMQIFYVVGVLVTIFSVRRHLRRQHNVPGSAVVDCIASVYPCSVWGITMLDYQLSKAPAPAHGNGEGARTTGTPGEWSSHLFACWPNGCHILNCACFTPWFIQLRLLMRLGVRNRTLTAALVFIMYSLAWTFGGTANRDGNTAATGFLSFLTFVCGVGHFALTYWLRKRVRARYDIRGSAARDVAEVVCCHCCALAQMERQTVDLVPAALQGWSTGADSGAGAGAGASGGFQVAESLPSAVPSYPPAFTAPTAPASAISSSASAPPTYAAASPSSSESMGPAAPPAASFASVSVADAPPAH